MAGKTMAVPLFDKVTNKFYLFNCTYIPGNIYCIRRYSHYKIFNACLKALLQIGLLSLTIVNTQNFVHSEI